MSKKQMIQPLPTYTDLDDASLKIDRATLCTLARETLKSSSREVRRQELLSAFHETTACVCGAGGIIAAIMFAVFTASHNAQSHLPLLTSFVSASISIASFSSRQSSREKAQSAADLVRLSLNVLTKTGDLSPDPAQREIQLRNRRQFRATRRWNKTHTITGMDDVYKI